MEIPLFALILQIGFNAALNNRGYNGNPLIPSARSANSGQLRRLPEFDGHQPLPPRHIPDSDSEQSDDEYSSFEDYTFRSVRPVQNSPNQRRNDYLRYNTGLENDASLESAPFGRINSNNYVDSLQSSSSLSRRIGPNLRRPYLRNGPSNLRQSHYYRKANDDLSLEVSSSESSNPEEASRLGEEASYLQSLVSLIEQPNDRRGQNRKYYRKINNLSPDVSPIDKLDPDEDVVNSLPSSPNKRRNYRKQYNNKQNDLRIHEPSPVKEGLEHQITNTLQNEINRLSAEEDYLSKLPVFRLGSVDIPNGELPLRRYQELANRSNKRNLRKHQNSREALKKLYDDNLVKNLVPYHEVKSNKIPNNRRHKKQNSNRRDEFLDQFSLDTLFDFRQEDHDDILDFDDNFSSDLSVLRSTNQDHLTLEPLLLRSSDENKSKAKYTDDTLHFEFPRNDQLSPNKSKNGGFKSQAALWNTKQKDSKKDTTDTLNLEFPWTHTLSPNKNKNGELRSQKQLRSPEQKDKTADTTDTLDFPWNDQLSPSKDKISNRSAFRKFKSWLGIAKEIITLLPTLLMWRIGMAMEKYESSKLSALKSKSQLRNSKEKDNAKDTTDILHLEFPWNDQLSPSKDKTSNLSAFHKLKSQLRNYENKGNAKDTTDTLHLEFPWNDALSSETDKSIKLSAVRSKSQLRNSKEKYNAKDTTDVLHLEFPWNDQLSPSKDKTINLSSLRKLKSELRSPEEKDYIKDTSDILHLEFPWNDALSPDENKTGELKSQSLLRSQSDSRQVKEPKDELKLAFPWNDKPSPNKLSIKKTAVRTPDPIHVHPYLRNRNIKNHPNYFRRTNNEFTEGIRLEKLKNNPSESHLRHSNRRFNDKQSLGVLPLAREDLENDTVFRDTDEDPSAVFTFPLEGRNERVRPQVPGIPSLLTTTGRPNDTKSLLNLIGDKNDRKAYDDTIIFPKN